MSARDEATWPVLRPRTSFMLPGRGATGPPRWLRRLLRAPLGVKLAGTSAIIITSASALMLRLHGVSAYSGEELAILVLSLGASLALTLVLVGLALRPLRDVEATADRVLGGDLAARVAPSFLADDEIRRVGRALNLLLDGLTADRVRLQRLAELVIRAQDEERARIARELHDSTAQTLAALQMQLAAARRAPSGTTTAEELAELHRLARVAVEEVRTLSHNIYPRVLDDLGLGAALEWLARRARDATGIIVQVEVGQLPRLRKEVSAVLYHLAQEGMRNALRHARPSTVALRLTADADDVTIRITDDGAGFDVEEAEQRRPGMGLFSMRERVSLVNGRLAISSTVGRGTTLTAAIPVAWGGND